MRRANGNRPEVTESRFRSRELHAGSRLCMACQIMRAIIVLEIIRAHNRVVPAGSLANSRESLLSHCRRFMHSNECSSPTFISARDRPNWKSCDGIWMHFSATHALTNMFTYLLKPNSSEKRTHSATTPVESSRCRRPAAAAESSSSCFLQGKHFISALQ